MKRSLCARVLLSILLAHAALTSSCSKGPAFEEPGHGESILDRVERIEPALITSIPATFRWCDRLPWLDKRRVDAGGAELYVEVEGKGTPIVRRLGEGVACPCLAEFRADPPDQPPAAVPGGRISSS